MPDPSCLALSPLPAPSGSLPLWRSGATLFLCRAPHCGTSLVERRSGSGAWAWELRCSGASLGPGADCVPCTAGEVQCPVSSHPELPPGSPWGGCSLVAAGQQCSSLPASLRARQLTVCGGCSPGDVASWFVGVAEIFRFSASPQHLVVLTVHLQIGPGSMQRPSGAQGVAGAGGPRPLCSPQTSALPGDGCLSQVRVPISFWAHLRLAVCVSGVEVGGRPPSVSFAPSRVPVCRPCSRLNTGPRLLPSRPLLTSPCPRPSLSLPLISVPLPFARLTLGAPPPLFCPLTRPISRRRDR